MDDDADANSFRCHASRVSQNSGRTGEWRRTATYGKVYRGTPASAAGDDIQQRQLFHVWRSFGIIVPE